MPLASGLTLTVSDQLSLFAVCLGLYLVLLSIYRLYFHPLAKIPGPKIAALSAWYAGYHDLIAGGQYIWVVARMHEQYGPIVRVRPDAVHVNDPKFIDILYTQKPRSRRERYRTITQTIKAPGSVLTTKDHDMHRRRRSALNPYFSKQMVQELEPTINQTLAHLLRRMRRWAEDKRPINMTTGFRAATRDVIQAYAFGEGEKCLDMEDCNAPFFDVLAPHPLSHIGTYMNWLISLTAKTPPSILTFFIPRLATLVAFVQTLRNQIDAIRDEKPGAAQRNTIFHEIMQSHIPESEKETSRLADEALLLVLAGAETTASVLGAILYQLLSKPDMLKRLKTELESIMPDPHQPPEASKLGELTFLNALIQEAIRFYPSVSARQDRTAPDEDLIYNAPDGNEYTIPAGSAVGMTAPLLNRHPEIYDRPNEFLPDRYIQDPTLSKYLMSFSKGSRQCVGINLAYQELQNFIAGIFRVYDVYDPSRAEQEGPTLELYDTRDEDFSLYADCVTAGTRFESHGLRVIIRQH